MRSRRKVSEQKYRAGFYLGGRGVGDRNEQQKTQRNTKQQ